MKQTVFLGLMMLVTLLVVAQIKGWITHYSSAQKQPALMPSSAPTSTDSPKNPPKTSSSDPAQTMGEKLPNLSAKSVVTQTTLAIKNQANHAHAAHLPYANPNAPKGGSLIMSAKGGFNSLNPFIDKGESAAGVFYLYDTLMTGSLDEAFVMYPQLARAVTYDPKDTSWVIYHLNPNARFWDGTAVSAHDVQATFEMILKEGLMSWRGFLMGIERILVLDDYRVLFVFHPSADSNLYANVALMPIFAKKDIKQRFHEVSLSPLMGSGAYQVERVDPPRSVRYVRDPNYWGAAAHAGVMANVGRFNFDVIQFIYYQDDEVAKEAFLAGVFNYRQETDVKAWAKFDPKFLHANTKAPIIKKAITHTNPVTMQGLVMNLRQPLFRDKAVRQAMMLAFDWQWANEHIFYGQYERLTSFFYGSELMATGLPTPDEQRVLVSLPLNKDEQSVWEVPFLPQGMGDGINRENILNARQLLLQAGFYYQQGRLYDKMGKPVRVDILVKDHQYGPLLFAYTQQLGKLGVMAEVRQVDHATYLAKKRTFDYDMMIEEFMQGNSPGAEQAYLWGSQSADEQGNANIIGIKSEAVDKVIDLLSSAQTRQEVILYTKVLDRLLLSGAYMIPLGGQRTTNVMYRGLSHPPRLPQAALGLDYWYEGTH